MKYAVEIDRSIDSLTDCLNRVRRDVENNYEWDVKVLAGEIDYGIYFNFDLEGKELIICNQSLFGYDESLYLDEIIDEINKDEEEEE